MWRSWCWATPARTVGESASRTSLDLPGHQLELVQAVYAVGKPVIVVLINGRPLSINWVNKYVPGISRSLVSRRPGRHGDRRCVIRRLQPRGQVDGDLSKNGWTNPLQFSNKTNAQWEGEKTRINGALYYFGHGLSYTTFAYSNLEIGPAKRGLDGPFRVITADVKNIGSREGDEVVQLYTRQLVSSVTTYEKNLRGFERIHLKPGESRNVGFLLPNSGLAIWDRQMHFVVEPGKFRVLIGSSSEDIRLTGEFTIHP